MTKQRKLTEKQQQLRWFNTCLKWLRLLRLHRYELTTNLGNINTEEEKEKSNWRASAMVEFKIPYRTIQATGDLKTIADMTNEDLDETACHEMVHVVLGPLADLVDQIIEKLPKNLHETYYDWKCRELETVTKDVESIVRFLHKAPKGK